MHGEHELLQRLLALRSDLAAVRMHLAFRRRAAEAKYNPNWAQQPRAPRGAEDGGQWVDGGGGGGKPIERPKQALPRPQRQPDPRAANDNTPGRLRVAPPPDEHIAFRVIGRGLGGVVAIAPLLTGDTPRPIVTARRILGTNDLLLAYSDDRQTNTTHATFQRILTPERREPVTLFGQEILSTTTPAITERLDVRVSVVDGEARFNPRALAEAYGREIPGVTVAATDVGIVTFNQDETILANRLRAQGANGAQIRNALEDLRRSRTVLPDSDRRALFPQTRPTGRPGGGNLTGAPARPNERDDDETQRSLRGQNTTAETLNRSGYRVHQNPVLTSLEKQSAGLDANVRPDLIVEGRVFDVISPVTPQVQNIHDRIAQKVGRRQAFRMVVDLEQCPVTRAELQRYLRTHPILGLREVITIDRERRIAHAYP